jgi:DNA-binding response OmpR family regulator
MDILIVDDNRAAAHSLARLLRIRGHRVSIAFSGKSAIEAATKGPDAVILDIGLPDMNGHEVARAIRARTSSVAIIALSGYGSEDDRRRADEARINAYLTKPALLVDIEAALATHLEK